MTFLDTIRKFSMAIHCDCSWMFWNQHTEKWEVFNRIPPAERTTVVGTTDNDDLALKMLMA